MRWGSAPLVINWRLEAAEPARKDACATWTNEMNFSPLNFCWSLPPIKPLLQEGEVHVWVADLEDDSSAAEFAATLSRDEEERASRFYFAPDRRKFITGRGLLRAILQHYTDIPAAKIEFEYESYGKPKVASASTFGNVRFNLSHSGRLGLYAFAQDREIGIDLENVHSFPDMDDIATRCFLPEEESALKLLPSPEKEQNFFRYWTRKEAQLKCSGDGFSSASEIGKRFDGSLFELKPAEGYIGALAVRGAPFRLKTWQWQKSEW